MEPVGPSAKTRAQVDAVIAALGHHQIRWANVKDDKVGCSCGLSYATLRDWEDHQYVQAVGAAELAVS